MNEEGRAYESGYEHGFIEGLKQATENKVSAFIDHSMRRPLTDEEITRLFDEEINKKKENWMDVCRAIERAHGIGEKK